MRRAVIHSTGSYLPQRIMTNADMERIVDTSHEWIVQRSGIEQRHIADDNQTTSDLAIESARDALNRSGYAPTDIDGIIVATTTPDQTFPSVAVKVQNALAIPPCMAFDVQAVCTGFVYALSVANNFITSGQSKRILVIGAEKMSSVLNWQDRTTCVLFGDGAGAVILEADESGKGDITDRGIISTHLMADGRLKDILYTDGGVSSTGGAGHIVMHGKEVFKHAVNYMADIVKIVLEHNHIKSDAIDWLVPHQANLRIITGTAEKLGMPMERVVLTLQNHGNTSAASIPLALDVAVKDGRIKPGQTLLFEALGGGLTWGAALVRF
jgi:3-oxoacyl-[acyl-carrier-protein] synthase-3